MSLSLRSRPLATALLSLLFVGLAGCAGSGESGETTVVDSAGVAVVEGPGLDHPLPWTAQRVMTLTALEEEGEGFFDVTDLAVVAGGRIAVLDGMGKRVVLFEGDGRFRAQYGREGSGPGEFQLPFEILALPGGGVGVFDVMNHRMERFDSTLSPGAPDPFQHLRYVGGAMTYAGSWLVLPTHEESRDGGRPQALTAVGSADTLEIVRFTRKVGGPIQLESCGMGLSGIEPLFSPTLRWSAEPGGLIAVAGTERYEIDLYRAPAFRLERRIRRPIAPVQADLALAEREVGEGMRVISSAGERVCDPREVAEKRGFEPEVPPVASVRLSPGGEIWVRRWAPGAYPSPGDVLTVDGEYLGTLPAGFPFPDAFLDGDRILVVEKDELDVASVAIYRVER